MSGDDLKLTLTINIPLLTTEGGIRVKESGKQGGSSDESKLELYKLRIEEIDRNYFSLREIEWRTAIEVLTGYVAIGIAHWTLLEKYRIWEFLMWGGIILPILLFVVYVFLSWSIQQRLHITRDLRNAYIKKLHKWLKVSKLKRENPKEFKKMVSFCFRPWWPNWYAFASQLTIHIIAVGSLVTYVILVHTYSPPPLVQ